MKNEIKEINIKIPGQILDYVDTKEHLLDLFNYITNLQETADVYNRKYREVKMLKEQLLYEKENTKVYKSRCEKAIEYNKQIIKALLICSSYERDKVEDMLYEQQNILQGVGKDE